MLLLFFILLKLSGQLLMKDASFNSTSFIYLEQKIKIDIFTDHFELRHDIRFTLFFLRVSNGDNKLR